MCMQYFSISVFQYNIYTIKRLPPQKPLNRNRHYNYFLPFISWS